MAAVKTLDDVLEGRFVHRVLSSASADINLAQVKYMDSHGMGASDLKSSRSFAASESALEYAQKLKHRFVDMKNTSRCKKRVRKKKNFHPIYNKIAYGHYNNIVRELKFGYTDAVKEEMRKLEE
ncbi:hypothetical protein ACLI09_17855 [Flavobacterium sp. RHBU_24]|uniref:hypothetical protein n=1 Tax=Flavobacterium sp. RHBU_24 TaxID=3391185 RepID=UPI0039856ADC